MNYFRRLVDEFCSIEQDLDKKRMNVKPMNKVKVARPSKVEDVNWTKVEQKQQLVKYYQEVPQYRKGKKTSYIQSRDGKKVVLLDLDKTLMFFDKNSGFMLIRPYLNELLHRLSNLYNIYIFSAATETYCKQFLQKLQGSSQHSTSELIIGYLSREHCTKIKIKGQRTIYIKDLNIIENCLLQNIVAVDDNPLSYLLNPENAIFISPYDGNVNDKELKNLANQLQIVSRFKDVRDGIKLLNKNE